MSGRDVLRLAWQAIWFHRQRSLLTTLGILIGIASVILLTSIGEGVRCTSFPSSRIWNHARLGHTRQDYDHWNARRASHNPSLTDARRCRGFGTDQRRGTHRPGDCGNRTGGNTMARNVIPSFTA